MHTLLSRIASAENFSQVAEYTHVLAPEQSFTALLNHKQFLGN